MQYIEFFDKNILAELFFVLAFIFWLKGHTAFKYHKLYSIDHFVKSERMLYLSIVFCILYLVAQEGWMFVAIVIPICIFLNFIIPILVSCVARIFRVKWLR